LYARLSNGLLKKGRVLFGDNTYLNSLFMVTPYTNVAGNPNKKSEDNYNFFHSQLRIRVECAFGMLAACWGCLRMALHRNITVTKVIALVNTLARLHNFFWKPTELLSRMNSTLTEVSFLISWITTYNL
jgi:hypothetical protein